MEKNEHKAAGVPSWWRSWRYFFWLLGVVLVVAAFYGEENWRGHHAWERYKQKLQARGEPVEPSAFIPKPVSDGENFAMTPLLAPLFEFIPGTQHWTDTNAQKRAQNIAPRYDAAANAVARTKVAPLNSWITAPIDLAAWAAAFSGGSNSSSATRNPLVQVGVKEPTAPQAAAVVLDGLAECEPIIEQLRADSRRPFARFNIRYQEKDPAGILLPHLAVLKHLCQILEMRACAELALGRTEAAFSDLELEFCVMDSVRDEPILISQLVRMSELPLVLQPIELGMGHWSEPQLQALQQRLERFDFCTDVDRALQAERGFFGNGIVEFLRHNPGMFDQLSGSGFPGMILAGVPSGWFDFEKLNHCRAFEEFSGPGIDLKNHRLSPAALRQVQQRVLAQFGQSLFSSFLHHRLISRMMLPGLSPVFTKAAFAQTGVDFGAMACALERYRRANGHWPESLASLVPGFIPRVPADIISGEPVKYRINDGEPLLYSVGWNETDEGGTIIPGKASEGQVPREGDWVWR